MGRGENNGQALAPSRQEPTEAQLANRRAGAPSISEVRAAMYSKAETPRLCSKYGIPVSVIRDAMDSASRYSVPERAMFRRVIEYLYPVGTRVRLEEPLAEEENPSVKPGDTGTVGSVDDSPTLHVVWDHGPRLGLIVGIDRWSVVEEGSPDDADPAG